MRLKLAKKIAPARAPEEPIHGGVGRERLGQQNQESRPHNKHVPRNKERRKQHPGTSINIPDNPETINREKAIHIIGAYSPVRLIQASREQQANRPATRTD